MAWNRQLRPKSVVEEDIRDCRRCLEVADHILAETDRRVLWWDAWDREVLRLQQWLDRLQTERAGVR